MQIISLLGNTILVTWLKSLVFKCIILNLLIRLPLYTENYHIDMDIYNWFLPNTLLKVVPGMTLPQLL